MSAAYHIDGKHAYWVVPLCPTCVALGDSQVILADSSATGRNAPGVFDVALLSPGKPVSRGTRQREGRGWLADALGRLASEQAGLWT